MPRVEASSNSSEMVCSFISGKEQNFAPVVEQHLKGSKYASERESLASVNNRVRFQLYREIIITIAESMKYDVSGKEIRDLSNISGLSFRNISHKVESYIKSKITNVL